MMKNKQLVVGVIGGMGPDATVELMRRVIAATPAQDDMDHIHMLVDNNPKIPSRIKALLDNGENPGPFIAKMAQGLQKAGADFLVIPCNTAHYYHSLVKDAVDIPVWHLIDLAVTKVRKQYPDSRRVGLLASSAVQQINLFTSFFTKNGFELIYPNEAAQQTVMQLIRSVKAGAVTDALLQQYDQIASNMAVDVLLLGCSELSTLYPQYPTSTNGIDIVDSLQVLVDEIVRTCLPRLSIENGIT